MTLSGNELMRKATRGWATAALAAIAFAATLLPAHAQQWQSIGLSTQNVTTIVAAPTALFAASKSGVYRSTDNGATWNHTVNADLLFSYWAIAAGSDNTVYVASAMDLFGRSTDGGLTWSMMDPEEIPAYFGVIKAIAVDNANYAYIGTTEAVFRSEDKGANWETMSQGLPAEVPDVQYFSTLPSGTVLAGTTGIIGGHIYSSANHGLTWKRIYAGIVNEDVTALAATLQSTILAGVYNKGLLRSTNEGKNWTPVSINGLTTPTITNIVVGGNTIYIKIADSVYRSGDDGLTWSKVDAAQSKINDIAVSSDGTLYAATEAGMYRLNTATDVIESADFAPAVSIAPMPANSEAVCSILLKSASAVRVTLTDISGKTFVVAANGQMAAGTHSIPIQTTNLPSGLYTLRVEAGNTAVVRTISIVH